MAGPKTASAIVLTAALFPATVTSTANAADAVDVGPVHDPCVIRQGDTYYLFGTGRNVPTWTSPDLTHWTRAAAVLPALPEWAQKAHPKARDVWAPDISFSHGEYRLYYAVSTMGSMDSTVGLATTPTLDPADPKFGWADRGPVISTHTGGDWNAIDPAAFTDADGSAWLAIGSYWSGLKLLKLDPATGKVIEGDKPRPIAARPDHGHSVEAAFLTRRGEWVYLWSSFDACCKGAESTYNVRVGRSRSVEGPYVDREGKPLLQGGGTVVLEGHDNERGPGHCAVLHDGDTDYLVHHWYDAAEKGRRKLGVRKIEWDADGWPHAGPRMRTTTTQPATTRPSS